MDQLLELQTLDNELIALKEEQAALPERRQRIQEARDRGEVRLVEARQGVVDAEAVQRKFEATLQDREALLKKLEGQQLQIKSNEAYTALLHEMDAAKQGISDSETGILEGMETLESARDALARAESEVAEAGENLDADGRALDARESELDAGIARAGKAREQVCPHVEPKLLEQYERISARRRPAVVRVTKEICAGCRFGIPPQAIIEILRGERVVTCGNCNRILAPSDKAAADHAS